MDNQVFRDPAEKLLESWRVLFNEKICSPTFNSKGAASAYLSLLNSDKRKPEYSN